jgi:hypothetical protein
MYVIFVINVSIRNYKLKKEKNINNFTCEIIDKKNTEYYDSSLLNAARIIQ